MITILAGGTGSVKLVRGISKSKEDLAIISNVGDNIWLYGLYICPDIDTIIYGLAGVLDEARGWGVSGDSFECITQLKRFGGPVWFGLGDKDIAMHLLRTSLMKTGKPLSEITKMIADRYSIKADIIPATDAEVTTRIMTTKGDMHLQEFWVKSKGIPGVNGVRYEGIGIATANANAIDAIRRSDAVIVAPANPISSIGPIIALPDLRKELVQKRERVAAISPLIGGRALSGPAAKYMRALGIEISPLGVAQYYRDFVGNFVISARDHHLINSIRDLDMNVYETNISMKRKEDEVKLGRYILSRMTR